MFLLKSGKKKGVGLKEQQNKMCRENVHVTKVHVGKAMRRGSSLIMKGRNDHFEP